ncbi:exodeoxyribonuclease VII small subunit [Gracilibacillus alcaliphilus]|uniref:exodeoxyribonuclease VII small subunit n=1 Tax=Gracilibacillus alcaliphilus TaxID=1401441 RepID=UPI00195F04E0|nr:exodeoxyribonuclease VII small subunit [Gracilibacillus alcaliphilus]MBM7675069.1 exodeoxyribonuclease VII small subunit [Gracilibacillus alcaliphilus]
MKGNYDKLSFEEALEKLETIVNKMEEGEVPLEQAMEYYTEGAKLSKICHDKLTNAEKQMKEILHKDESRELFQIEGQEEE